MEEHTFRMEENVNIDTPPVVNQTRTEMTSPNRITIEDLPNELLASIFNHLEGPRPSISVVREEPTFDLTRSEVADLKSISLVSKRWRHAILPVLFKNGQFICKGSKGLYTTMNDEIQPFVDFITQNSLSKFLVTFTLIVHDKRITASLANGRLASNLSPFWKLLLDVIDPIDLLLVAPAEALGTLTSCVPFLEDVWCLDCPCQYLLLQRSPKPATKVVVEKSTELNQYHTSGGNVPEVTDAQLGKSSTPIVPDGLAPGPSSGSPASRTRSRVTKPLSSSALFEARPWTKILLNEGSFIKAYTTYEYFLKRPPSILPDLLGDDTPRRNPVISPTIRDMEYVGIFPMGSHFSSLTKHLPRLDRLYVQIVPRNEILQDARKMAHVEAQDLWSERNTCYALLMRELFSVPPEGNYAKLKIFESGDAADRDAWNMAVEFVKRATDRWKVAEEGVFVRDAGIQDSEDDVDAGETISLSVTPTDNLT